MTPTAILLTLAAALPATCPAGAEDDCRRFRGSRGNGLCAEDCPDTCGPGTNVACSVAVPSAAWSAPVTCGSLVVVTTAIDAEAPKPLGFAKGVADPRSFGAAGKQSEEEVAFEVRAYDLEDGTPRWVTRLASQVPPHRTHP